MERDEQRLGNEGGHMSSTSGRIRHVADAVLPYVVVLKHPRSETTEHAFASMREAEAFIKRNTPTLPRSLSTLYDRPPSNA